LSNLKEFRPLEAPFIKIRAEVTFNAKINGKKPKVKKEIKYKLAPSGKKVATYITNQIFGSDIVLQAKEYNVNWLMPTLKEVLENCIYCKEAFVYLHKFEDKVYLECIKPNNIFNIKQKYDKVYEATIIECFDEEDTGSDDLKLELHRKIKLENGTSYINFQAYSIDKFGKAMPIAITRFNQIMGTDYLDNYILPYEVLINIDCGQEFFKDSKKLLIEEMNILDVISDEVEKTRTKVATTQHFQTGNIVTSWQPMTQYNVQQLTVGKMQDYFTLLPGDKDHYVFEYLQGDVRVEKYIETFKFYDYQIIQMAGLSPASFGYEKDSYMNKTNVDLSANASEMTIEAIKTQIEPQINNLLLNIYKMQTTQGISKDVIPVMNESLEWDYGANERLDDQKKIQLLKLAEGVANIPYEQRAKIIAPLIQKLINDNTAEKMAKELIKKNKEEAESLKIEYGEI
jgi:hypothetical protein